MPVRTNSEGLLEILHPETGAYVQASALLQVEGGWLAALVPNQVAMLSDIRNATTHLELIENVLIAVQSVLTASDTKLTQSNTSLNLLPQVNTALGVVNNAIDSLETLGGNTNSLLQSLQSKIDQLSGKFPTALGAKIGDSSLSVALSTDSAIFASLTSLLSALSAGGNNTAYNALTTLSGKLPTALGAKLRTESLSVALATDSTIFTSLANLLTALTDGGANSVYSSLVVLSNKLPASVGAKLRTESLSVALATDSTVFASLTSLLTALTDGGANSVYSALVAFSSKLPASVGAKLRTESLSVALATDSTVFTSLTSLLTALTDGGGANSVYSALVAFSNKLPASVGAKLNASSLSVALAADSTVFTSLASIISALSSGGSNTTGAFLNTIATSQFWVAPVKINTNLPIINAATTAVSSVAYTIAPQAEALSLQNFFSAAGLSAQFAIELRVIAGATSLSDKTYYYRGDVSTPFAASAGAFPGESPIIIPTYGYAQVVVSLVTIAGGGNVTTFLKEIK